MFEFYKHGSGVIMHIDETHLKTEKFAIERPAIPADIDAPQTNTLFAELRLCQVIWCLRKRHSRY